MENAAEALKIAGGVILFVLALTLSISCFSQATRAVNAITTLRDRDIEYEQVQSANGLTRAVGVETIIPTMYTAYSENIEIYFFDKDGDEIPIYYKTDQYGRKVSDGEGGYVQITSINLEKEGFGNEGTKSATQVAQEHLDIILGGESLKKTEGYKTLYPKYENQIFHKTGFYEYLKGKKFEELLGEYYQGEDTTKIKKRVITYREIAP